MSRQRMNWDWLVDPDAEGKGGLAIIVFSEYLGNERFRVRFSTGPDQNKLPGPREPADQEAVVTCRSHLQAFEWAKLLVKRPPGDGAGVRGEGADQG